MDLPRHVRRLLTAVCFGSFAFFLGLAFADLLGVLALRPSTQAAPAAAHG